MNETKLIKPKKVLCKRTLTSGKPYYWDEESSPPKRVEHDNRMLVEGNWYDVVENENDSWDTEKRQFTFTIIDNQKNPHLFYMYEEQDKKDWPEFCYHYGPRDYTKWFYTPEELLQLEKGEFKLKEDIFIKPGAFYWVNCHPGAWMIAFYKAKNEWYVTGAERPRTDSDFIEIGSQVISQEQQIKEKKKQEATEELFDEVAVLVDAINKNDPDKEYPSVEYIMPFVNKAMDKYFDVSFAGLADIFNTDEE